MIRGKADELLVESLNQNCDDLLGLLDEKLREVATLKLQGYTNQEIADAQNRSVKSVERYLKMIRQKWEVVINPPT